MINVNTVEITIHDDVKLVEKFGALAYLSDEDRQKVWDAPVGKFDSYVEVIERRVESIEMLAPTISALTKCDGNITASAKLLGITRHFMYKRIGILGLDVSDYKKSE